MNSDEELRARQSWPARSSAWPRSSSSSLHLESRWYIIPILRLLHSTSVNHLLHSRIRSPFPADQISVSKRLHMSSETPAVGDGGAGDAPAPAKISKKEVKSDASTWLDIIKKVYEVIKVIIPLIKKCFGMAGSSSSSSSSGSSTTKSTKDYLTQLANILPTSTYLSFQVIAPLATNNAHCGDTEKIVTGVLLGLFGVIIAVSTFTDSVKIPSTGKVYYGVVSTKGLWSPAFKGTGIPGVNGSYYTLGGTKYKLRGFDFVYAVMSLAAFATLALLTDPVSSCFFKKISATVLKVVPLLVSVAISFVLYFAPTARNGIGFRVDSSEHEVADTTTSSLLQHEPAHSTVAIH